jgi:hypothetical protein
MNQYGIYTRKLLITIFVIYNNQCRTGSPNGAHFYVTAKKNNKRGQLKYSIELRTFTTKLPVLRSSSVKI